jgi:hypothetical protein
MEAAASSMSSRSRHGSARERAAVSSATKSWTAGKGTARSSSTSTGFRGFSLVPGGPICAECVEWVRWLRHYAGREPVSTPRFGEGDFVLRAGTEEIYRILEARLTGLPAAGIWFPAYRCQRIEVRGSSGEILPACLGLEFELADFEVQPLPPRYAVVAPRTEPIDAAAAVIDLVGKPPKLPTIDCVPNNGRAPSIAQQTRRLLTGKGGGT